MVCHLRRLERKRSYRKRRSRLKKKLRSGSFPSKRTRTKYNLSHYVFYRRVTKNDIINIQVPRILCLIEDHNGTLDFLYNLGEQLSYSKPKHLKIVHTHTEIIGLTASYIFDTIVQNFIRKWKNRNIRLNISGNISNHKSVNNFLLSFGLLSKINIKIRFKPNDIDYDYRNKYEVFQITGSNSRPHMKSEASTRLAGYFRKCLNYSNLDLTMNGFGILVDAIGEIIGNAEEHSGNTPGRWVCLGCYDKETAQCGFSIFNYGATIYKSLSDPASTSASVLQTVTEVINDSKNILIKIKENVFSTMKEECIWNVMALQDGISSKRTETGPDSTRGQGLMDVLEFVETLRSNDDPVKVAVISGRSKILVDYKYPIQSRIVNTSTGERRRFLPFNKEGSLRKAFDPTNVLYMDDSFDGVIITGSFKINEKYLINMLEKSNGRAQN